MAPLNKTLPGRKTAGQEVGQNGPTRTGSSLSLSLQVGSLKITLALKLADTLISKMKASFCISDILFQLRFSVGQ